MGIQVVGWGDRLEDTSPGNGPPVGQGRRPVPCACLMHVLIGPCAVSGLQRPRDYRYEVAPEENESRTTRNAHIFCSPCFFPADSRFPPECTPHSKVIKILMRFWLRLFFSSFRTPCLRSGNICLIWSFRWLGGWAILLRKKAPEIGRL